MEHVWDYCTEHGRCTLEDWELDCLLGEGASAHVIASRLGTATPDGIYIAGTKGRIEWLSNKRQAMRKATTVSEPTKTLDIEPTMSVHCRADNKEQEQEIESSLSFSLSASDARAVVVLEPLVDVSAVADAGYQAYPAGRREGKTKGISHLRKTIRTPEDAARFQRVLAAHIASASEEKYIRQWERFCRTWHEMPEVAPARASPARSVEVGHYKHTGDEVYQDSEDA